MKGSTDYKPPYVFDAEGNLVAEEGESDEARLAREAEVLYKEGLSANTPEDVAAQHDEQDLTPTDPEAPIDQSVEEESADDDSSSSSSRRRRGR